MLRPLYGLNQPYNCACTPSREALNPNAVFITGQWLMLTNGKVELAAAPEDGLGAELCWEPSNKNWSGTVPTISGFVGGEAETDQFVTASTYADKAYLVTRNGVLDVAANATEEAQAVAKCIGVPVNGVLRFKKIR